MDTDTGAQIKSHVFVAVLPYSGYAYVEAFMSQNQESWTTAHVNAYKYFGGVTRILRPDNLKTGVTSVSKSETVINRTYLELAEHYGTAVIPAAKRVFLEPPDRSTESHWRAEIRAGGAGPRVIEANTNIKSHLS